MTKIYIDPGHGGSDPGAVANGLKEKDITLSIARYMKNYLEQHYTGFQIKMSRTRDITRSLANRTNEANKWGADVFVSIHVNAGGGVGFESFIYPTTNNNTKKLQDKLHYELKGRFSKDRGQKTANYHVLRETKMNAVLTENGFIDSKTDSALLKEKTFLRRLGESHGRGVAKFLGLKSKKKTKVSSNDKLYRVQVGAFRNKDNAKALADIVRKKGFDTYIVKY